jgi:outer membrane protein assembly factor BamB
VDGRPVLFSSGAKAHYAYDPATGREFWRVEEPANHSASTRPVLGFGFVYILTGFSKGQLLAVKLPSMKNPPANPITLDETQIPWRIKKSVPNKPSLLLVDGLIYMVDDGGIASCVDAKTGEEIWRQRVQGNFSSSPIYSEGHIYAASEEGKVYVMATGREFKLLAENKLEDGVMASPAVSGKALFYRTKTALYRLEN